MPAFTPATLIVRCACPGPTGVGHFTLVTAIAADLFWFWYQRMDRCWTCRRFFKATQIKGKLSNKHECGSKCMASKGPSCECSCGGANHGKGWAI